MNDNETRPLDAMGAATVLVSWLSLMLIRPEPVAIGLFVIALLATLARGRMQVSRVQWLLFSLVGLLMTVALLRPDPRQALATSLISPNVYPVAVALAVATLPALVRRHTRREYWFTLSLSGLVYLICGLNLAPMTAEFGAISALWTMGFCISSRQFLTGTRPSLRAYLTFLPTLVILGVAAYLFALSEQHFNFLLRFLNAGGDVSLAFPAQARLDTMMAGDTNPAVVARCFGQHPNTYLGARVYANFDGVQWSEFDKSDNVEGQPMGSTYRYRTSDRLPNKPPVLERFEVHASPIVLFAPRDAGWMEVNQSPLAELSGHLLESRGGTGDVLSYTVARWPEEDLAPAESEAYLKACLQLPPDINPVIGELARQVCGDEKPLLQGTRCVEWFHTNFKYGFGHNFAADKDPIGTFLTEKPPAHCQAFAQAMTLMMRTRGIPARYINGFVCVERSWSGYYVVRVRDAHAWVEIWDGQAWRLLDPTPPLAIQPSKTWGQWFDLLREAMNYYSRNLGLPSFRTVLGFVWERRRWLGLLFVGLAIWKFRKASWLPRAAPAARSIPQNAMIKNLSTSLAPYGLSRESWETLLHWAQRLRETGQTPTTALVADWLEDYSRFRYGGGPEGDLGRRLDELVKTLRNRPS